MANLKVGKVVYDINEKDVVLFNGVCWILLTREVRQGYDTYSPTISKLLCEKLKKKNILIFVKAKNEYVTADGKQMGMYYYRFDINKLEMA